VRHAIRERFYRAPPACLLLHCACLLPLLSPPCLLYRYRCTTRLFTAAAHCLPTRRYLLTTVRLLAPAASRRTIATTACALPVLPAWFRHYAAHSLATARHLPGPYAGYTRALVWRQDGGGLNM